MPCSSVLRVSPGKYPKRANIQKNLTRELLRKVGICTCSCSILYPRFQFILFTVFECCTEITVVRKIYAREWHRGNVWKATRKTWKLSEVQLLCLNLRLTFHTLSLRRQNLSAYARKNYATVEIRLFPSQCLSGKNTDRLAEKKRRSWNTELGTV